MPIKLTVPETVELATSRSINRLGTLLRKSPTRTPDGEPVIEGKTGNVHQDGNGFCAAFWFNHGKTKRYVYKLVEKIGGKVVADGDRELVVKLPTLPLKLKARSKFAGWTKAQVRLLGRCLEMV